MKKQLKILVVEPNWLGDVIFTTPAFKAIKKFYPESFLGVVVARRTAPILKNNPYIDKIFKLNEKKEEKSIFSKINFIKKLKLYQFDKVILFHRSFTKTLLIYLSRVKEIIGYDYKKRSLLLTKKIPKINKDSVHKQDYYLNILKSLGINIDDKNCQIYLDKQEERNTKQLIPPPESLKNYYLIGLNPFSNWTPKNWPLSFYRELIEKILTQLPNSLFFITSQDKQNNILNSFGKFKEKIIDLSGKTDLRQLAAIYKQLDLVISGDSGPLHLAGSLGTKFIAIFGPTDPECTKPINAAGGYLLFENKSCKVPCYIKNCPKEYYCINQIKPERVSNLAIKLLINK